MSDATFPIMDGPSIPLSLILPHERQALENHDQTLSRLAERGGLSCCEAVAVLEDRKWQKMDHAQALARLNEIRNADWQSRALAAERELIRIQFESVDEVVEEIRHLRKERDQLKAEKEAIESLANSNAAESLRVLRENQQLKAELQQAREALNEIDLEVQEMESRNGEHYYMDKRASHIRAILERIEK